MNYDTSITNLWEFDFYQPQPTQDSDLLKQLGFVPGLKELLMVRQVHALEHGTVWILSEMAGNSVNSDLEQRQSQDNEMLGGMSTERGFYLYGQVHPRPLEWAVYQALRRFKAGDWNLAVHPRCGTNLSVSILLTSTLALGAHLFLPRGPIEQLMGLVLATTAATQIAPDLGLSAQKYLTTAIPFNLEVTDIRVTQDFWGRRAHFVEVEWRDLQ
ncbi:conserved hypothetical protein [Rippkaea orientalis PCC 8801]|uniref:Uncharacterized protein n=1 Tax=Rippkaea orientalis (strain PCC 8801 / RF-1) TaxID=41431 RepID=B7K1S9_RIPO1|nr:DUF6391 domain-containing protein [Rippkaea orientalis]ACK64236.1 conserved hypothetical protein [Rippkaea orientalis PCC 8801]